MMEARQAGFTKLMEICHHASRRTRPHDEQLFQHARAVPEPGRAASAESDGTPSQGFGGEISDCDPRDRTVAPGCSDAYAKSGLRNFRPTSPRFPIRSRPSFRRCPRNSPTPRGWSAIRLAVLPWTSSRLRTNCSGTPRFCRKRQSRARPPCAAHCRINSRHSMPCPTLANRHAYSSAVSAPEQRGEPQRREQLPPLPRRRP